MRRASRFPVMPVVVSIWTIAAWTVLSGSALAQSDAPMTTSQPAVLEDPLQSDAALSDVYFVDQQRGWAVGRHGTILHTADGGATWQTQQSGVEASLQGVAFIDAQRGWVVGGKMDALGVGGQGIVLQTQNGGRTWRQLPTLAPALRRVQFFDEKRGIAVGCGSESAPSGVMVTLDGGLNWNPRGGGAQQVCFAADFRDLGSGVVAGAAGRAAQVIAGDQHDFRAIDAAGRTVRDAALAGPSGGWLVGDGGLVYRTQDHGQSWQTVGSLPATEIGDADLRTVASIDNHVWIAGAPGTYVLHSADRGESWQRQPTGVRTPINRLRFVDAQHGWAVGDLGVALATNDGGDTWQVLRGGNRRAALLAVASSATAMPVEALAGLALDEGYRAVAYVVSDPGVDPRRPTVDLVARLEEAMTILGLNSASLAWQFPAPSPRLQLGVDESWARLEALNDGRTAERMVVALTREIRMWRPDVLVVPSPQRDDNRPLASIVGQAAVEAASAADDPTRNIQLSSKWNLPPWQVSRIFAALPPGTRGTHHLDVASPGRRLNRPPIDLAAESRSLLHVPRQDIGAAAEFQLLLGDAAERPDDLMAGLSIAAGGPARREWIPGASPDNELGQRKLVEKRRNLRRLIESGAASPAWLGEIVAATSDFEADAATSVLWELAQELRDRGQLALVADMMQLLVQRYPDHPRSDEALAWLIQYYASAETARAYSTGGNNVRQAGAQYEKSSVEVAGGPTETTNRVQPASSGFSAGLSTDERLARAAQLAEFVAQTRPRLYAQQSLRFPWAAAQRKRGFSGSAERYMLAVERSGEGNPWQQCAAAEAWLREPDEQPPAKPIVACRVATERPHLDGRLDEPIWQSSSPVRLRNADPRAKLGAVELRLAYDSEYLYVSAQCAKVAGIEYATDDRPRPYDGDVQDHDHLRILLDLDRDYSTWFELAVDYRGWTADRCWGDASWNPRWYVAPAQDAQSWSFEAAIPWSQLTAAPPRERHVWAAAVERVAPPVGMQSWTGVLSERPSPEDFGLMIFE